MLNVAGAGVHRMERYGKRFLNAIAEFIQAHPKVTKRSASTTENRAQKPEFYLTLEDAENFVYKDHCFISEIRVDLILFALLMIPKKCVFVVTHYTPPCLSTLKYGYPVRAGVRYLHVIVVGSGCADQEFGA